MTLSGLAQFGIDNILLVSRTRGRVEFRVAQALREKVFPADLKRSIALPGKPDQYEVQTIKALPSREISLDLPESEFLLKALEAFEANEAGPGITTQDGDWFYPLVEALAEELKGAK